MGIKKSFEKAGRIGRLERGIFLEISTLTSVLMREASKRSLGELVRGLQRQSKWKLGHV